MTILSIIIFVPAVAALGVVLLNVFGWRRVRDEHSFDSVSLLVPARNEEDNLAGCLESAIRQQSVKEIIVADDHSTDRTAEVVRDFMKLDPRIRLVRPEPLPEGWCGKNHACYSLAREATGDWMLFLDADARLPENAVSRMLAECEQRELTFLSCWPQLEMRGFWERLLMPMLNFVLLTLYPAPLAARRKDHALGLAHGACILMRTKEYREVGGHASVKSELFEDTRLAQLWRECGHRGLCLDGTGTVRVRMYDSLGGIWTGFRKNLYPAFRNQLSFWLFMLAHAGVFLLPFALAWLVLDGSTAGLLFVGAGAAVLLARLALALRFGHPLWSVMLHPLAEVFVLAIGVASWWQVMTGRGVSWKGRRYRTKEDTPVEPAGEAA